MDTPSTREAKKTTRQASEPSREKVLRVALGALLSSPKAAGLSANAAGCLVVLTRFAVELMVAEFPVADAQAALSMKGVGPEADLLLRALRLSELIHIDGDLVRIPVVLSVIEAESIAFRNRQAGWSKREGSPVNAAGSGSASPAPAVSAPAVAPVPAQAAATAPAASPAPAAAPAADAGSAAQAPLQLSLDDAEGGAGEAGKSKKARRAPVTHEVDGVVHRRFTRDEVTFTDPGADPVVVIIPCERGNAEITAGYVADLAQTFPRLDIENQLRLAALWARSNPARRKTFVGLRRFLNSWLSNASRDADVRNAVVRTAGAKNGFGQGGTYREVEGHEVAASPGQGAFSAGSDPDEDLADLLAEGADTHPTPVGMAGPVAPAAPAVEASAPKSAISNSVLAARQRRFVGRASGVSGALKP